MRKMVRLVLAMFLYYTGIVGLFRWLMRRSGLQLIILNYHAASHGDLRRHLRYLQRYYRVLHLDEALAEIYSPPPAHHKRDTRTVLAITFDDGYHDNYTHAFAYARELQIPITIFLIPGYIESHEPFWWFEGELLAKHTQVQSVTLDDRVYQLDQPVERQALASAIDHHVRNAQSVAERERFLRMIRDRLGISSSSELEDAKRLSLTWGEVLKMQESGLVSFGGHTMHHPVLSRLADSSELKSEVADCRAVLEDRLQRPVRSFAYPIGREEHIGEMSQAFVKESGYQWAVTTNRGFNTPESNPFMLKRVPNDVGRHWLLMAAEISGIWHVLSPVWKPFIRE